MSTPRQIDRPKRRPSAFSASYSGASPSFRRLSTVRLGSPILNETPSNSSPRPGGFHTESVCSSGSSANHVLIDMDSPSFATTENYNSTSIQHYLNSSDALASEGGDITRSLQKPSALPPLKKTKSASNLAIDDRDRRGSSASGINVPGGFRREFLLTKAKERSPQVDEQQTRHMPFLTRNFIEFLYIYGHFAGEDFEDEFVQSSPSSTSLLSSATASNPNETSLLLPHTTASHVNQAKGHTSTMKAFLLMLKSFVGTGVLFLPKAFSNGGMLFSIVMLVIFGAYSYYCYYILVESKVATKVSSFGDIGAKLYGSWMKTLILISLVLTQIGFACAYIIFVSDNLVAFCHNIFNWNPNYLFFFILQLVIFIPLSFIRNVSKLSLTSLMANFCIISGLFIVLYFTLQEIFVNGTKQIEPLINGSKFSLFIGTAIFAFEGIGLIIPIQDSMAHPEKFPLVLSLVILTISILMIIIASIGYLAYGENIQTVILLNLPQSNFFVNLIQLFYSTAIMLSTPLQLFPAIGIIERKIFQNFATGKFNKRTKWTKNLFRSCIVVLCIIISWFGANNLDRFVSFVGCFACIPLVYMYPPMLHLRSSTKGDRYKESVDIALLFVGAVAMAYTSYQIVNDS